MTQEFYDRLEKLVKECEAHPYKSSEPMDFCNGWEGRVSKKHLGTWSEEDYDILYNFKDERVNKICDDSRLECFVFCNKDGYMYLCFE